MNTTKRSKYDIVKTLPVISNHVNTVNRIGEFFHRRNSDLEKDFIVGVQSSIPLEED